MKRLGFSILLFAVTIIGSIETGYSIPAPKSIVKVSQPDGRQLPVYMKGDEFFHYAESPDGYILRADKEGFYTYAIHDTAGNLIPGYVIATDESDRSDEVRQFLKTIKPGLTFSEDQRQAFAGKRFLRALQENSALRSGIQAKSSALINDYPTQDTVKSLVILVNYSDVSFTTTNAQTAFDDMLNQEGYDRGNHIGSVRDYYTANSSGIFIPEFTVVGPVTLSNPVSYYGANDEDDEDVRPANMIRDACVAASSLVDFSEYDADNDGAVDNVYVFYAGKGEADGGSANTIWPHSWSLTSAGLRLTLDGKKINEYACSAELDGSSEMTGMGPFAHEYGHIVGLPDLYDVDYDYYNGEAFDIDMWSLMAYGAYNGDGCVPPCLTLLERQLLGWTEPVELNSPTSQTLASLASSNKGYIIKTSNDGEYFLLENRQQTTGTWDAYLPYHGLLIYHIDRRSNATTTLSYYGTTVTWSYAYLWQYNMVNAISNHQCADIEEADDVRIIYTGSNYTTYLANMKGDPFPGSASITSFTDNTTPSMLTWSGTALDKPIDDIAETNSTVFFNFMGGDTILPIPVLQPAQNITPFSFTANWQSLSGVTGYMLDVYTVDNHSGDTIKTFISGYENLLVTDTSTIVHVPYEQTTYYYKVRSTNGFINSGYSDSLSLITINSKPSIKTATDITSFNFMANWAALSWATGYYLTVYKLTGYTDNKPILSPVYNYSPCYVTDTFLTVSEMDSESTYLYCVKGTDGYATGISSDTASLTTQKSSVIITYTKDTNILSDVRDRMIYIKGIDPGTTIKLYDSTGQLKQVSTTPEFLANRRGLYFAEIWFDGNRKIIKILVR